MRPKLFASTALTSSTVFAVSAALAADLPLKAAPAVVPYSWSGCYAGLNAGGASVNLNQQVNIPGVIVVDSGARATGFVGGGQIGCNWQFDPQWVVGLEGDIDYANANRTGNFRFRFGGEDTVGAQTSKLRWLSTVRGRLGHAWGRTLLYGTGGLAIGGVDASVSATRSTGTGFITGQYSGSYSATRAGWTLGAGIEHAFTDRVSAKLEYLHFDLGSAGYNVNRVAGTSNALPLTWNASARWYGDIVRVGVNVKLN